MGADALYYIMDYSGNYYRTNQADQLVAVAGEQDATVFTFAQANSRICVGKKAAFYCMVPLEEKAEDRDAEAVESGEAYEDAFVSPIKELAYRGLGDVYKRQYQNQLKKTCRHMTCQKSTGRNI